MNHLKSALLVFAAALVGTTSAIAGVRDVVQTKVALLLQPDNAACLSQPSTCTYSVTYTTPASGSIPALNSYIGYEVAIANTGKNTVNKVTFTGTLSVTSTKESAPLFRVDGATCQTSQSNNLTSISCDLGTLASGQSVPKFQIFFTSPIQDKTFSGTDTVSFSGITYYSETTNGGSPSPKNSQSYWGPAYADAFNPPTARLGTPNPTNISTTLPASNQPQSVFTGDGFCGTVSGVPFTTYVSVPPTATTTAAIGLTSDTCNSGNFNTCYSSRITIPGTFSPYLNIVLRTSSGSNNNIKTTNIGSVQLTYDGSPAAPPTGFSWPIPLAACSSPTTPNSGDFDGVPCIAATNTYTYTTTTKPVTTQQCFEWTLLNHKNGSYRVF